MTTRVTIDAHAGWPVAVTMVVGESSYPKEFRHEIVEPNTVRDFYIHSGMRIVGIEELKRDN